MRLDIHGTFNFREPSGLLAYGGRIRSGVLYRSDALARLGERGRQQLSELGVRRIIDLRGTFETEAMPDDVAGLQLERTALPIDTRDAIPFWTDTDAHAAIGTAAMERLNRMYSELLAQNGQAFATAVQLIAAQDGPTLVHCTAGKDRTGVLVALLLSAVGVEREAVLADYELSQSYLAGEWLDRMIALLQSHGIPDSPDLRLVMGGSPRSVLAGALAELDRQYGDPAGYLQSNGVSADELARLHKLLVEAAS